MTQSNDANRREVTTELIEFSLHQSSEVAARKNFPMLAVEDIRRIYAMHKSQREEMLANRMAETPRSAPTSPERFRNQEQAEKMAQMEVDPSNR